MVLVVCHFFSWIWMDEIQTIQGRAWGLVIQEPGKSQAILHFLDSQAYLINCLDVSEILTAKGLFEKHIYLMLSVLKVKRFQPDFAIFLGIFLPTVKMPQYSKRPLNLGRTRLSLCSYEFFNFITPWENIFFHFIEKIVTFILPVLIHICCLFTPKLAYCQQQMVMVIK